jgi:hypothetical protein
VRKDRRTVRLTASDRSVVVTIGPGGTGRLAAASTRLVRTVSRSYTAVRVLGHRHDRVDGRAALTTYGLVRTSRQVPLRFLVLVVTAKPQNYALTTFAAAGSDPRRVLPLVDQVAGSMHVLPPTKGRPQDSGPTR